MAGWGGQSLGGQWQSPPPICLHPSDSVQPRARCRSGLRSAQLRGCSSERVHLGGSRRCLSPLLPSLPLFTNTLCFCSVTGSRQVTVPCRACPLHRDTVRPHLLPGRGWPQVFPPPPGLSSVRGNLPLLQRHSNMKKHSNLSSCCSGKCSLKIALRLYDLRL